jgi:leucyl/phenylalanyl-tRNA--protein transferase
MSFPHDDIVAVGGDLEPATVIDAYRNGVFPWPIEGLPLVWFCPVERAILEFDRLHVSRSLGRARRRARFEITIDRAFSDVIRACADTPRRDQRGTWITPDIVSCYTRLHEMGIAHSVEAWSSGELVGGIYGVDVDGAFSAESMFHLRPDASKLALFHLIEHLRRGGLDWLDIQVMTPHMERLGARIVARPVFLRRLAATQKRGLDPFRTRTRFSGGP